MKIKEKLLNKSEIMPNGCMEWRGSYLTDGYGQVGWRHKKYRVHRLSYELFVGEIPEGHVVRHKCDNPKCLNPEHLITGTVSDNNRDCKERGRNSRGAAHHKAKITECQAIEIFNSKKTLSQLSKIYGVSQTRIADIKHQRTWRSVTGNFEPNSFERLIPVGDRFMKESSIRKKIFDLVHENGGLTRGEIADLAFIRLGVDKVKSLNAHAQLVRNKFIYKAINKLPNTYFAKRFGDKKRAA